MKKAALIAAVAALIIAGIILISSLDKSPEKPSIWYGSDVCDMCGMVIAHTKYASAYYSPTEKKWRKFDDLGCMLMTLHKEGLEVEEIYVTDYESEELILAQDAFFVVVDPREVWTPMSSGIIAFKNRSSAESFAEEYKGKVYNFNELMDWFKTHRMGQGHGG